LLTGDKKVFSSAVKNEAVLPQIKSGLAACPAKEKRIAPQAIRLRFSTVCAVAGI
jgi:hypothetical protein